MGVVGADRSDPQPRIELAIGLNFISLRFEGVMTHSSAYKHFTATLILTTVLVCCNATHRTFGGALAGEVPEQADLIAPVNDVYALLIGVEDYESNLDGIQNLSYAIDDAVELGKLLEQYFGYKVQVLKDPTRRDVFEALDEHASKLSKDDAFIFFYAGHGHSVKGTSMEELSIGYIIPRPESSIRGLTIDDVRPDLSDRNPFIPPKRAVLEDGDTQSDEDYARAVESRRTIWIQDRIKEEQELRLYKDVAIRITEIRDRVFGMRAKHAVTIFDSCYSGLATRTGGGIGSSDLEVDQSYVRNYRLYDRRSRSVLTSGTGTEEAIEHNEKSRGFVHLYDNVSIPADSGINHGVFTYELLSLLKKAPESGISLGDLHIKIRQRVDDVVTNMDASYKMTPQHRPQEDTGGEFVFVPRPSHSWLLRVQSAATKILANQSGIGTSRGLRDLIIEDQEIARLAESEERLVSKALVVLAFQANLRNESGLEDNTIWVERYNHAINRASIGDPNAMAALYYMYRYGLGTRSDSVQAGHWATEASSSDSGDAQAVWIAALESGLARANLAHEEHQRAHETANQRSQTGQGTTAVGAAGAIAAFGTGNEEAGLVGAGAVVLGALMMSQGDSLEEPIEVSIAQLGKDMDEIRGVIDRIRVTGRSDMDAYDAATNSIRGRLRSIVQRSKIQSQGAVGREELLSLIGRTSSQMQRAMGKVQKPVVYNKYMFASQAFQHVEMEYAKLVALMPYQLNDVAWE